MKRFESQYKAEVLSLHQIRADVGTFLTNECDFDSARTRDFQILMGEVLQNIIRYEYLIKGADGKIHIEIICKGQGIETRVIDDAPPLNDISFLSRTPVASEHGGMGLELIRNLSKSYTINALSNGNEHLITI